MVEDEAVEDETVEDEAVDGEAIEVDAAEHDTENTVELTVNPEAEFIPNSNGVVAGIQDKNAVKCTQTRQLINSK